MIVIKNQTEFAEKILPNYFKHKNFVSFVRQLNMYGFNKVGSDDEGIYFSHTQFYRGGKKMLKHITRKMPKRINRFQDHSQEELRKKLEKGIEEFSSRLAKLEERNKMYDWLKKECQRFE